jgi:hypothetical protein
VSLSFECIYRKLFGIICPFCGGTRFFTNFIRFRFLESFRFHPTSFIYAIFWIIMCTIFITDKIQKRKFRVPSKVLTNSVYVYLIATFIQYFIRLILIHYNIENPFIYIDI